VQYAYAVPFAGASAVHAFHKESLLFTCSTSAR